MESLVIWLALPVIHASYRLLLPYTVRGESNLRPLK